MTPEPAQKCGAMMPALKDFGWECSGIGLIVVTRVYGRTVPVVLPRRALEIIEPESWWDFPVRGFSGGDHCHLVVPRTPSGYQKTDSVLMWGGLAYPAVTLGHVFGDDPFRQ